VARKGRLCEQARGSTRVPSKVHWCLRRSVELAQVPSVELQPAHDTMNVQRAHEYLGILDFEATCADKEERQPRASRISEIIEFPLALVHIATKRVVDQFVTVVRPTLQPELTDFCKRLTHITQSEVDQAPTMAQAFDSLNTWLRLREIDETNTLLVTCGDWDLKMMWPRQVGVSPLLWTPPLFQRWCNLKVIFSEHTRRTATGLLGMLQALELPHRGQLHRGADDVLNLTNIVLRLLDEGATFRYTWGHANRKAELERWLAKFKKAKASVQHQERTCAELSETTTLERRNRAFEQLCTLRDNADRLRRTVCAFQAEPTDVAGECFSGVSQRIDSET
jgi:inhibitor of KinA sporulation pathway (predicted exonuclease)